MAVRTERLGLSTHSPLSTTTQTCLTVPDDRRFIVKTLLVRWSGPAAKLRWFITLADGSFVGFMTTNLADGEDTLVLAPYLVLHEGEALGVRSTTVPATTLQVWVTANGSALDTSRQE